MNFFESFGTFGVVVVLLFLLVHAILTFLLPFIVWGILRQAKAQTALLEALLGAQRQTIASVQTGTREGTYQTELAVAALQRIKDGTDQLVQHADYQSQLAHRAASEG